MVIARGAGGCAIAFWSPGAGFIGSNFVLSWLAAESGSVVNLDLLTYAGNPANLAAIEADPRYRLVHGDICDGELVRTLLRDHRPRAIVHFAAESHVDRSIASPDAFIRTNVRGHLCCWIRRARTGLDWTRTSAELSFSACVDG